MSDLLSRVSALHRPRLLIQAARAGVMVYNRNRDLKRLIRTSAAPPPDRALSVLLAEEERIETDRCNGGTAYSLARHIDLLIALMAEVKLLGRQEVV